MNFRDLWEYINKKLQNDGENTLKIQSDNPYLQSYLNHLNELDELTYLTEELESFLSDPKIPLEERQQAELQLKLLKLKPLQSKLRE